jgi:hypothetical protein
MNEHAFSTGHLAVVDKFSHETNSSHLALKLVASSQYPSSLAANKIVIGTPLKDCRKLNGKLSGPPICRRRLAAATSSEQGVA